MNKDLEGDIMKKVILGILAFIPLTYAVNALIDAIIHFVTGDYFISNGQIYWQVDNSYLGWIILFTIFMQIYFFMDISTNRNIKKDHFAWCLIVVLFGFLSLPIYWYLNIYRDLEVSSD